MTELLIRRFVPGWEKPEAPEVRRCYGRLGSIVGIVVNLLLSAGKLLVGLLKSQELSQKKSSRINLAQWVKYAFIWMTVIQRAGQGA